MLILYWIKWHFHCLFRLHRQMTIWDSAGKKYYGCVECNQANDSEGNTYVTRRT